MDRFEGPAARSVRSVRRAATIVAAAAVVGVVGLGCGSDDSSSTGSTGAATADGASTAAAAPAGESEARIAYFTDALDNLYLQAATDEAKKKAAAAGAKIDVYSGDWDPGKQLTQVQDAISSGKYNALVVESIDGAALCRPLQQAAKTMVVAVYNTPICNDRSYTEGTVGYFGRDDAVDGKRMGELTIKALNGKGNVAYVSGPVASTVVQRLTKGLKDELATAPGIKLVASAAGDWDPTKGRAATEDILQSEPDLQAIVYGTDNMAAAGVKAIKAAGRLDKIKVIAYGGTKEVQDLIREGSAYGTVHLLPREEAGGAVQLAIDTVDKRESDIPGFNPETKTWPMDQDPVFEKSGRIITKENVDDYPPQW
jgi:ABC-type sugar transport system substrate-binding protein